MKKRITSLMLILVVAVSMTMGASAASYIPDDVTYQNLNGQQLAIKTYTLLPDQDPSDLYEDDFEYDGFLYSMSDIVKEEQRYQEENAHTEVVTVTTASKNLEDILAELKPTIEYDDGVSSGTLSLDHSTLKTEAAGYKRSSYTVTATKNYTGLDRNDSSYIDKTVEKNGRTLSLSNVTWSVESTALVGDELVPATYSAVALILLILLLILFNLLGGEIYLAVSWYTFVCFILHIHLISHFCVPHLKFLEPKWSQIYSENIHYKNELTYQKYLAAYLLMTQLF